MWWNTVSRVWNTVIINSSIGTFVTIFIILILIKIRIIIMNVSSVRHFLELFILVDDLTVLKCFWQEASVWYRGYDWHGRGGIRILSSSAESISHEEAKRTRFFQHEKIKSRIPKRPYNVLLALKILMKFSHKTQLYSFIHFRNSKIVQLNLK